MTYDIISVKETGNEDLKESGLSKDEAAKRAQELASSTIDQVYVTWYRSSDGQSGYLNYNGDHAIIGKAWPSLGGQL